MSILKTPSDTLTSKKKGIVWDEDTIQEHDLHRGQCQKIDEPDTPYNREFDPEVELLGLADKLGDIAEEQDEKEAFKKHRKAHYNEFEMAKRLAAKVAQDQEEEEQ